MIQCGSYKIFIEDGLLDKLDEHLDVTRETIIITDKGIPDEYILKVEGYFNNPLTLVLPEGEETKSLEAYQHLLEEIASRDYSRAAQIIALGGGVVGDLTGFVAATYLRGVSFIQIPTTLLSQVDSAVGSKVAVNHFRKNNVGTFYDPEVVLIDPLTLKTLSKRHFNNGMAEVIKYAFTLDKGLLNAIDDSDIHEIIERCLSLKRYIVCKDPRDHHQRHILNFGHTIGHAIEIHSRFNVLHGEAIAIGMYKSIDYSLKGILKEYLIKFDLPYEYEGNYKEIIKSDKKIQKEVIKVVRVKEIGKALIEKIGLEEFLEGVELDE